MKEAGGLAHRLNVLGEVLHVLHRLSACAQLDRPLVELSCAAPARGHALSVHVQPPERADGVGMILSRGLLEPCPCLLVRRHRGPVGTSSSAASTAAGSEEEKKNIVSLQEYIDDLNKRQKWRQQLRKANTDHTNRLDESELRKFDSSLKKVNFCTLNMRYTKIYTSLYLRVINCPLQIHFLSFRIQLLYEK